MYKCLIFDLIILVNFVDTCLSNAKFIEGSPVQLKWEIFELTYTNQILGVTTSFVFYYLNCMVPVLQFVAIFIVICNHKYVCSFQATNWCPRAGHLQFSDAIL